MNIRAADMLASLPREVTIMMRVQLPGWLLGSIKEGLRFCVVSFGTGQSDDLYPSAVRWCLSGVLYGAFVLSVKYPKIVRPFRRLRSGY